MSRYKKQNINQNQTFICTHCGTTIIPIKSGGSHRNHCPNCLWSRHLDLIKGDRRSGCKGDMEPIGIWARLHKEWSIIHRCNKCGFIKSNRIASDDNETILLTLAMKPVTSLPFSIDRLFELYRAK